MTPFGSDLSGFRLTLAAGTPVTTSDVTAAGSLYFSPFKSDRIFLPTGGSAWSWARSQEITVPLSISSGNVYDVFAFLGTGGFSCGGFGVELSKPWTSLTARAEAVVAVNGAYVKQSDPTRLLVGTVYAQANNQTEDSYSRRLVWNAFNRTRRPMKCVETTNSWTYTTVQWRAANAGTTDGIGRVACVQGLSIDPVIATARSLFSWNTGTNGNSAGIGVDSTSANSAIILGAGGSFASVMAAHAYYRGYPGVGYHYIQWLETVVTATNTCTWYGDNGSTIQQSGLAAEVQA